MYNINVVVCVESSLINTMSTISIVNIATIYEFYSYYDNAEVELLNSIEETFIKHKKIPTKPSKNRTYSVSSDSSTDSD